MELNEQEKRQIRKKRRQRNQIIAYAVVILFIIALAAGIVRGVDYVAGMSKKMEQEKQEQQDKLEDLFEEEEKIQTPEPTPDIPEVVELTPEQKLDEIVNAGIEVMPLEDKVAGLFIVTPESITGVKKAVKAGEGTKEALSKYSVGGIVYFGQNIKSKEQFQEMIGNTILYSNYPIFIAIDEEGGSVSRLASAGLVQGVDSATKIAQTGEMDKAYQAGNTIGTYLTEYGINLDFAPVADLANIEKSVIGDRSFGSDASAVSAYVNAMMKGLQDNKVTACLKHFPGLGDTSEDSHDGMATTEKTLDDFNATDFPVYQAGINAGVEFVMVSHISAPNVTGDNTPASLSSKMITEILRGQLGYQGIVITDAMNMKAITEYYTSADAAVMALQAGADMILMPENYEEAYNGVLEAVNNGTLTEERIDESLKRIFRIKCKDKVE